MFSVGPGIQKRKRGKDVHIVFKTFSKRKVNIVPNLFTCSVNRWYSSPFKHSRLHPHTTFSLKRPETVTQTQLGFVTRSLFYLPFLDHSFISINTNAQKKNLANMEPLWTHFFIAQTVIIFKLTMAIPNFYFNYFRYWQSASTCWSTEWKLSWRNAVVTQWS